MIAPQKDFSLMEAAALLGVNRVTMRSWIAQGCPHRTTQRGRVTEYRLKLGDVLEWREKRAVEIVQGDTAKLDIDEARRRKVAAEAALAELDLAKQKGSVVPLQVVSAVVGDAYANVRARLLALPSALAPQVVHMTAAEARVVLEAAIEDVLGELSDARIPGGVDADAAGGAGGSGEREVPAAAEADVERVGGPVSQAVRRGKRRARAVAH